MRRGLWPGLAGAILLLAGCMPASRPPEASPLLPPGAEGIDLSHHNGAVDWTLLATEPFEFVYLKASEGTGHADPQFQTNWASATRIGWRTGAYHFYLLCRPGLAQAENFIRQVEVRAGTLPPAVDLEHAHNCAAPGTRAETMGELRAFLAAVEAEYGQTAVIYTTPAFHAEWLAGEDFGRHPLWVRSLSGPPDLTYAIWQHSMKGRARGIDGPVDLNRAAD
ncbi:GH25 family lysozyme [Hyphomonas sp.]|uniref:GH25 family lysozyme n=1 Tax=Hyphomonas sp. TaxID=87 RepID=UPI00391B7878